MDERRNKRRGDETPLCLLFSCAKIYIKQVDFARFIPYIYSIIHFALPWGE